MTTKPRASKFRIKRAGPTRPSEAAAAPAPAQAQEAPPRQDAPTPRPAAAAPRSAAATQPRAANAAPQARSGQVASAAQVKGETSIDAIRKEGLTGRQLRMARRIAQKNGIAATSDFEAVKLLRERGIDPFQASGALELVVPNQKGQEVARGEKVQLPQTVKPDKNLPAKGAPVDPTTQRAQAILSIQRDIAKRRRRRMFLLFARLAIFVGLPTFAFGYYFAVMATPLYATKSAFLIQQNEATGGGSGGLAGMFGSNQLATVQDSIAVQGYLTSREAMLRLNEEHGFKAHFQDPEFDAISRLPDDASNEDAFKIYSRHVKIGYDPTEGIIDMEVIAGSPEASQTFSNALITYAEGQVSDLSQ
ncbi:MAG: capsule biosynthesis protein, partial [Pseudomonadota bacterium]